MPPSYSDRRSGPATRRRRRRRMRSPGPFRKTLGSPPPRAPVAPVLHYVHWVEPAFLGLNPSTWLTLSRDAPDPAPLHRPSGAVRPTRPGWAGGKRNATTVLLEPAFAPRRRQAPARSIGSRASLDEGPRARIPRRSRGEPALRRGDASDGARVRTRGCDGPAVHPGAARREGSTSSTPSERAVLERVLFSGARLPPIGSGPGSASRGAPAPFPSA